MRLFGNAALFRCKRATPRVDRVAFLQLQLFRHAFALANDFFALQRLLRIHWYG